MPFGNATFSDLGTAVSDVSRAGRRAESEGAAFEQQSYQDSEPPSLQIAAIGRRQSLLGACGQLVGRFLANL